MRRGSGWLQRRRWRVDEVVEARDAEEWEAGGKEGVARKDGPRERLIVQAVDCM